jgi:hypothetical protein
MRVRPEQHHAEEIVEERKIERMECEAAAVLESTRTNVSMQQLSESK